MTIAVALSTMKSISMRANLLCCRMSLACKQLASKQLRWRWERSATEGIGTLIRVLKVSRGTKQQSNQRPTHTLLTRVLVEGTLGIRELAL